MGFLEDFNQAITNYATDYCDIEIIDFSIVGGGTNLQVGEDFSFKVRVTNRGHVDMKSVLINITSTNFAERDPDFIVGPPTYFNLSAHQTYTTGAYRYTAKKRTNGIEENILTASIATWDASLNHILKDNTNNGSQGTLTKLIERD